VFTSKVLVKISQMTVEDLLTGDVYTFELQEELICNSECDGWKEIPVKVDALTAMTGSDQQVTDDHRHIDDVSISDADDKVATSAAAATVDPTQSESQLSRKMVYSDYFRLYILLHFVFYCFVMNKVFQMFLSVN